MLKKAEPIQLITIEKYVKSMNGELNSEQIKYINNFLLNTAQKDAKEYNVQIIEFTRKDMVVYFNSSQFCNLARKLKDLGFITSLDQKHGKLKIYVAESVAAYEAKGITYHITAEDL